MEQLERIACEEEEEVTVIVFRTSVPSKMQNNEKLSWTVELSSNVRDLKETTYDSEPGRKNTP